QGVDPEQLNRAGAAAGDVQDKPPVADEGAQDRIGSGDRSLSDQRNISVVDSVDEADEAQGVVDVVQHVDAVNLDRVDLIQPGGVVHRVGGDQELEEQFPGDTETTRLATSTPPLSVPQGEPPVDAVHPQDSEGARDLPHFS